MEEKLHIRPMTEEERKEWIDNLDGSLLFTQHLTWEEVRKACIRFLKLNDEYCHEMSDMMKKANNISHNIYEIGDKRYRCAVMNKNTSCGYRPDEVFFINCFLADCKDKKFLSDLEYWEASGTVVHYW